MVPVRLSSRPSPAFAVGWHIREGWPEPTSFQKQYHCMLHLTFTRIFLKWIRLYALIFNTGLTNFQDWVTGKCSKKILQNNYQLSSDCFTDNGINGLTLQQHMRQAVKAALKIYLQNDTILFMSSEACDWLAFCSRDRRMPWTMSWPWLVTTWFPFYKD